jgi:membrane protease YdiL (CAAX protease family)
MLMQIQEQSQPQAVPWTVRDVWVGLVIFGLWLVAFIVSIPVTQSLELEINLGLAVSVGELLLLLPVWWLTVRKYQVGWKTLGLRSFNWGMIRLGCGLMLLSFAFNLIYGLLLALFDLRIQIDLAPILAELSSPWLLLFGGTVIAPIVEEIFFRGFIFAGLRQQYGWQRAALISSALFALLHLTPTAILPILILGYIFAYLYHRSGSIWPAILMHMLTNSLALGAAYVMANADKWGITLG